MGIRPASRGDPLFGDEVREAIATLCDEGDPLRVIARLRRLLPAPLARRAAELHSLRARARVRFPNTPPPFLTAKGLEQASAECVARARAERVAACAGGATVLDATCGIGADSLALSRTGVTVIACDRDPFHAACTAANLRAAALPVRVAVADAAQTAVRADLLLLDPDRRALGRRSRRPDEWSPSLAAAAELAARHAGACLKLPGALDLERARAELPRDLPVFPQWVGARGELAELALWTGILAQDGARLPEREALRVDAPGGPARLRGVPEVCPALTPTEAAEVAWIAEPDPAVIRAGLVGLLARQTGLRPVDPQIAYLAGAHRPHSPLLGIWRVLGSTAVDARRVRSLLAHHDVGPLTVKKRGHPDSAAILARRLRGRGERPGTLVVARIGDGHRAWLVEAPGAPVEGDGGFEPPTSSL